MKQAAHELALTPGAVSQRIRQLEEAAGRRLFTRTSTGVELSAAGEAMFVALAEPFQAIEAVDMELGSPSSRRVTECHRRHVNGARLLDRQIRLFRGR